MSDISPKGATVGGKLPGGQYGGYMEFGLANSRGPLLFGFNRSNPFRGPAKFTIILGPVTVDSEDTGLNQDSGGNGQQIEEERILENQSN